MFRLYNVLTMETSLLYHPVWWLPVIHGCEALEMWLVQPKTWILISFSFSSVSQLCPTLCDPMNCSTPGLPVHHHSRGLPKLMSIELVMPSNHLILCNPLLLLPSIFPRIRVFSNESALCIRWPRIGVSASTSVLPVNTQDWSPLRWTAWISLQS